MVGPGVAANTARGRRTAMQHLSVVAACAFIGPGGIPAQEAGRRPGM